VFEQAWHAQVLAIADTMVRGGHFSADDWATTLGAGLKTAETQGKPDTTDTYYHCAVQALETLVAKNDLVSPDALAQRYQAWTRAYLATPHGKPVTLNNG